MENKENNKVIFGLSPRATIINAIVLFLIGQLFWGLKFMQQFPEGFFDMKNPPADFQVHDNVPWYFNWPFFVIALFMTLRWIRYTFKTTQNIFDANTFKYEVVYLTIGFVLLDIISRAIILLSLISLS